MTEVVVKTWINGDFKEVGRFKIENVQQIQHQSNGLRLILNGYIKDYNTQSVIEFE